MSGPVETIEGFIAAFGRDPDQYEEKWLHCTYNCNVDNKPTPVCYAFLQTDNEQKLYPIPPEWQEEVYGKIVDGLTLAGEKQFTLAWQDVPDTETFVFDISANYEIAPKPPNRDRYTSAKDCEQWWPYCKALGHTRDHILNIEDKRALFPQPHPED